MEIETKVPIVNPTKELNNILKYNFGKAKIVLKSDKYYFTKSYESKNFLRIRCEKIQNKFTPPHVYEYINECLKRDLPPKIEIDVFATTLTSKDKTVNSHGYEENVEAETELGPVDLLDLEKTFSVFGLFKKFEKNKLSVMFQLLDEPFNVEFVYAFGDDWTKGKWYCEIETTDELQERYGTEDWKIEEYESRIAAIFAQLGLDIKDRDNRSWVEILGLKEPKRILTPEEKIKLIRNK